ncbi:MAG: FkbM family methyltransferase [bacterium]
MTIKSSIKDFYKKMIFNLSKNTPSVYKLIYKLFYNPKPGTLEYFANRFSKNNPGLTVVQVGANDGINQDPIHKFIRRDGWKGVLLEPQKNVYQAFLKPLHANAPDVHTLNAALSHKDGQQPIYRIAFSSERWATGLTSFRKEVLEEAIDTGHVARCAKKSGISLPENKEDYITEDIIEAVSPKTLLNRYDIKQIDWLQIDTEGFDFEVIKMFDIAVSKPRVIVFEHSHLSVSELAACNEHLKKHEYRYSQFGGNTLAIHASETDYMEFFARF